MNPRRTIAVIGVIMLFVTGCKAKPKKPIKGKDDDATISCEMRADYPHQSRTDSKFVDGKVFVICKGDTADKVSVEAFLERWEGGKWVTLPPAPGWKENMTYTAVKSGASNIDAVAGYPCSQVEPGDKFRTRGKASVTDKGKSINVAERQNPNPEAGNPIQCR